MNKSVVLILFALIALAGNAQSTPYKHLPDTDSGSKVSAVACDCGKTAYIASIQANGELNEVKVNIYKLKPYEGKYFVRWDDNPIADIVEFGNETMISITKYVSGPTITVTVRNEEGDIQDVVVQKIIRTLKVG